MFTSEHGTCRFYARDLNEKRLKQVTSRDTERQRLANPLTPCQPIGTPVALEAPEDVTIPPIEVSTEGRPSNNVLA